MLQLSQSGSSCWGCPSWRYTMRCRPKCITAAGWQRQHQGVVGNPTTFREWGSRRHMLSCFQYHVWHLLLSSLSKNFPMRSSWASLEPGYLRCGWTRLYCLVSTAVKLAAAGWLWALAQVGCTQELRDLLDPTRHLKLREDPKQGFFVEGGKEETVVSLEHALAVVHIGQHYRTVGRLAQTPRCPSLRTGMLLSRQLAAVTACVHLGPQAHQSQQATAHARLQSPAAQQKGPNGDCPQALLTRSCRADQCHHDEH